MSQKKCNSFGGDLYGTGPTGTYWLHTLNGLSTCPTPPAAKPGGPQPWLWAICDSKGRWKDGENCVFSHQDECDEAVNALNDDLPEGQTEYFSVALHRTATPASQEDRERAQPAGMYMRQRDLENEIRAAIVNAQGDSISIGLTEALTERLAKVFSLALSPSPSKLSERSYTLKSVLKEIRLAHLVRPINLPEAETQAYANGWTEAVAQIMSALQSLE